MITQFKDFTTLLSGVKYDNQFPFYIMGLLLSLHAPPLTLSESTHCTRSLIFLDQRYRSSQISSTIRSSLLGVRSNSIDQHLSGYSNLQVHPFVIHCYPLIKSQSQARTRLPRNTNPHLPRYSDFAICSGRVVSLGYQNPIFSIAFRWFMVSGEEQVKFPLRSNTLLNAKKCRFY
jgi:hypothetical protein